MLSGSLVTSLDLEWRFFAVASELPVQLDQVLWLKGSLSILFEKLFLCALTDSSMAWLFGCLVAWLLGYLVIWSFGCSLN